MDKIDFELSLKNIPTTNKRDYFVHLTQQTENFIRRMRWKAFFFLQNKEQLYEQENYGFKSLKTAPIIKDLLSFENDLLDIIKGLTFYKFKNCFQKNLDIIVKDINKSEDLYVKSDKTANFYKLSPRNYDKLVTNSLTSSYKKINTDNFNQIDKINSISKSITDKLKISDRVSKLQPKEAYILLKDHKPDFRSKPSTRIINPTRPEIGRISKNILE